MFVEVGKESDPAITDNSSEERPILVAYSLLVLAKSLFRAEARLAHMGSKMASTHASVTEFVYTL